MTIFVDGVVAPIAAGWGAWCCWCDFFDPVLGGSPEELAALVHYHLAVVHGIDPADAAIDVQASVAAVAPPAPDDERPAGMSDEEWQYQIYDRGEA